MSTLGKDAPLTSFAEQIKLHIYSSLKIKQRRYFLHNFSEEFDVYRHKIPPTRLFTAWEAIGTMMLEDTIVA
jgi:hypothetical protein